MSRLDFELLSNDNDAYNAITIKVGLKPEEQSAIKTIKIPGYKYSFKYLYIKDVKQALLSSDSRSVSSSLDSTHNIPSLANMVATDPVIQEFLLISDIAPDFILKK